MAVKVTEHLSLDIVPISSKKYNIIAIRGKRQDIIFSSDKQITSFTKNNSGRKVLSYLDKKIRHDDILDLMRKDESSLGLSSDEYKSEYIERVLSELEILRSDVTGNYRQTKTQANDEQLEIDEIKQLIQMGRKYPPLYQQFSKRCIELGFTPLEFVTKICDGLGVGLTIEVLRAFFGFLQTYLGYKGTNVIAVGSQASGKALALDTKLITPKGYTTISDVQIGDELFDEKGNVCQVIAKSPIWEDTDCYRITFDNNDTIVASGNHIWNVTDLKARSNKQKPFEIKTSEMFERGVWNDNGGSRTWEFKIDNACPLKLEDKELPIDPYILGCWLGDGDSANACICNEDEEVIDYFKKKYELTDLNKNDKNIHFYVKGDFHKKLRENNLLNNKHIPLIYLRGSYVQRLRLLQGLMDTDGTISKSGKCTITQKNYELTLNIRELLLSLGIKCNITETQKYATNTESKTKRTYYNIHFTTAIQVFSIKRKRKRLHIDVQPNVRKRIITNIEKIAPVPTQCIQVNSESSMFLCGDYIPTHNSHIIETALKFIPQERVHYGAKSVAYFFRKYNHQDLTGHIFYIGDLGGSNSDQNTIDMRDLLKQLSTDGYIERGVVDNSNENVTEEQWVKGYPCLAYTTAHEDIINEQEKSRSIIITPPFVDPMDLVTFKSIMNNQGSYASEIRQVELDTESVQGLVHFLANEKTDVDMFDLYMYDIVEYIGTIDDFNRKVDEFNSILKLSCTLNKGKCVYHEEYGKKHPLLLASKQDVRTALTIFDNNNNLLPNEVKLINGIFKEFDVYNVGNSKSTANYEETVKFNVGTLEGSKDVDWLSENTDEHQYFFTTRYLKSEYGSRRWYSTNRNDIEQKIRKLYDNNYLICIGEDNKAPVYAINGHLYDGSKVNRIEPNFSRDNLEKGKDLLLKNYRGIEDELQDFIDENRKITKKSELFFETLMKSKPIYNLGWLQ